LLAILLLLLGGLLDGLFLGSTGAIRVQDADVFVFSADARDSFLRSRIDLDRRAAVEATPGVRQVSGLGITLSAGRLVGADTSSRPLDLAVIGYERPANQLPPPPAPGEAWADGVLRSKGIQVGDTIEVGPTRAPVKVAGFVDDTNYLSQSALWVNAETWRTIQSSSRPDAVVGPSEFQALLVDGDGAPDALADAIDASMAGATSSLTRDEAVLSLPGTRQQQATFGALIGTTLFVVGLVSALFFVLLSMERRSLYATMKALGVGSAALARWSVLQAVVVASGAFVVAGVVTVALSTAIAGQVPLLIEPVRVLVTALLLLVSAAVGGLAPLRRIVRLDPATAIS
jgi:putative ABC transport system permease protein